MRIESNRPMRNGGWWHWNQDLNAVPVLAETVPQSVADPYLRGDTQQDGEALEKQSRQEITHSDSSGGAQNFDELLQPGNGDVNKLAGQLGVSPQSLHYLGTCYSQQYRAWAFPMCFPSGKTVGIRLRSESGQKWSIKGSRSALFIPFPAYRMYTNRRMFICEGPTDTAAALTLDLFAVGRPACLGCEEMIAKLCRDMGVREAVIVCDNDDPGIRGAERLRQRLRCSVAILIPPAKDLREFVASGGTVEVIQALLRACIYERK